MFSLNMRRRIVFSLSAFLILAIATLFSNALPHEYNAHICVMQAEKLHLTNKDVATQYKQIIAPKYDTIGEALFHELCHAFHSYSGMEKMTSAFLDDVYRRRKEKYLWTNDKIEDPRGYEDDEEAYNITGFYLGGFDPISCNMYDIAKCFGDPSAYTY
ncbi:MAG: hypothetical protein LBF65_01200 [Holosporales bacterium]|nr:hypothetical protein [Holosporales bacterium]